MVYRTESFLSPISKGGKILKRVISPVDVTATYSYSIGCEAFIYTTEAECIEEWNKQINVACDQLQGIVNYWNLEINELKNKVVT
jgi:hypothetical protein